VTSLQQTHLRGKEGLCLCETELSAVLATRAPPSRVMQTSSRGRPSTDVNSRKDGRGFPTSSFLLAYLQRRATRHPALPLLPTFHRESICRRNLLVRQNTSSTGLFRSRPAWLSQRAAARVSVLDHVAVRVHVEFPRDGVVKFPRLGCYDFDVDGAIMIQA